MELNGIITFEARKTNCISKVGEPGGRGKPPVHIFVTLPYFLIMYQY